MRATSTASFRPLEPQVVQLPIYNGRGTGRLCVGIADVSDWHAVCIWKSEPEQARSPSKEPCSGKAPSVGKEGIMDFLAQNWFYIVALILFVAMHLFGFGCGHGHEGHRHSSQKQPSDPSGAKRGTDYQ